ncbi:hypothetical protein HDE_06563 [Halotydeus destructor]|nr:hypothetical protein HDE_06563 [Halotydeus destructor]
MPSDQILSVSNSYRDDVRGFYSSLVEQGKKLDRLFQFFGVAVSRSEQRPSKLVTLVQLMVIGLVVSTLVRSLLLAFLPEMEVHDRILYLGDVGLFSLQSTFAVVTIGYQVHCLLIVLVFALAGHQDWPLTLRDLHFTIADLPLLYSDSKHILGIWRFRKRMLLEIAATLVLVAGSSITMIVDVAIKHYGDYSLSAYLFWSLVFSLDIFVATGVSLFSLIRFGTCSKLITTALDVVNKNLEMLADRAEKNLMSNGDFELFSELFRVHERAIAAIAQCNRFWKSYLLVFYVTLIPCMCFLLHNLLFSDTGLWNRAATFTLALCMMVVISYKSMVAAQVHDATHACYDSIYRVVLHQKRDEVRTEGSLWLQRLSGPPISFYFWDFVPMTTSVLTSIFSVTLTYLFLISDSGLKTNKVT